MTHPCDDPPKQDGEPSERQLVLACLLVVVVVVTDCGNKACVSHKNTSKTHYIEQTQKLPLVRMSASWFLVSTYWIWDLGFQADSVEQPIKRNSVGSGHMSHRRTSSFNDHMLITRLVVFKDVQTETHFEKNLCLWGS